MFYKLIINTLNQKRVKALIFWPGTAIKKKMPRGA